MSKCCFFFRFQSSLNVVHFLSGLLLVISVAPSLSELKKLSKQKIQKWTQWRGQKILLNWIAVEILTFRSSQTKQSFFQNGIFFIPQSQTKTQPTLMVRDS